MVGLCVATPRPAPLSSLAHACGRKHHPHTVRTGGSTPFARLPEGGAGLSNRKANRRVIDGRRVPAGQWRRAVCKGGGITCPKVCAGGAEGSCNRGRRG